jgi:hypothetical protein
MASCEDASQSETSPRMTVDFQWRKKVRMLCYLFVDENREISHLSGVYKSWGVGVIVGGIDYRDKPCVMLCQ